MEVLILCCRKESKIARAEEHAGYFFDCLERCCAQGYVLVCLTLFHVSHSCQRYIPTLDDVLHVRMKTTGIKEICFAHKGNALSTSPSS